MKHRMPSPLGRYVLPALLGALAAVCAPAASAALTDIANAPLTSSGGISVKPNLMFILDDSGSMRFDGLPDNAEPQQGESERKQWSQVWSCKKKFGWATHCDRVDPPFGAVEFNGMYYNPQQTYKPAIKADNTSMPSQTSDPVKCDPFTSNWSCEDFYTQGSFGYYKGNDTCADINQNGNCDAGEETFVNGLIKEWYGTNNDFKVRSEFPEIVHCLSGSSSSDVNNTAKCRRNGIATATDSTSTGNPFRYTSAQWRSGYPESPPVHEFWRPGSGTTVTVTTGDALGLTCGTYPCAPASIAASGSYPALSTPFKVIPRTFTGTTGSGLDVCTGTTCTTTVDIVQVLAANQFTYAIASRTGQRLANGQFDMIVGFKNGTNSCSSGIGARCTVYVTAPDHGLKAGDQIKVYLTSGANTNIIASNGTTVTVLASPAPTASTFAYTNSSATANTSTATGFYQRTNLFNVPILRKGTPFYYTITPLEHCSDDRFTLCTASTTPTGAFVNPAPVRFCSSEFDANRLDTPTGNDRTNTVARCQKKYNLALGYVFPRYGQFQRTDILSTGTYGARPLRTDCANAATTGCTAAEEQTNFANWFSYYRHRMLMMKTSSGLAFAPIDARYRVGFVTINTGSPVKAETYLKIADFTPAHRTLWYDKFYARPPGGGTPLPIALSRVGRHYAGKTDGINNGMPDDPMEYSCQQNFALLTTDGYWNARAGKALTDTSTSASSESIGNQDNNLNCSSTDPKSVCRGVWDGYTSAYSSGNYKSSGTLADVALYYYNTDLRTSGTLSTDNVPTGNKDNANWQHMTTFGLGMAEGLMNWRKDYESASATSGDFYKIKTGQTGCSWDSQCRWPVPGLGGQENLDDLWHAAVNGRGTFFYARDTSAVQDGLVSALTNLNERNASGSAAATSTPNITPSDRAIFKSSYTTVQWNGEIIAQEIDPNTGAVQSGVLWSAKSKVQELVQAANDLRTIKTFAASQPNNLIDFKYVSFTTPTEQGWFANKCAGPAVMNQCSKLDLLERVVADSGTNMVNFLRGQSQHEVTIFRDRQFALGDTVNATPLYVGAPRLDFGGTYTDWKNSSTISSRTPTLYVGANDGMLHAFNANSGAEMWAYIPRMLLPDLWRLAEDNYAVNHRFYVDGSPTTMDVFDGTDWRTILVGGLNSGGRGYYALDITNPQAPKALWEFCSNSALCAISDPNLGLSYGNPIITKLANGRWVVLLTSGYNNVSPGDGKGYLYVLDAITGQIITPILTTGVGDTTTPSGLGKLNAWFDTFSTDNTASSAYAGDLLGNIWEFNMNTLPITVKLIAQAKDGTNKVQPITTKPELGLIDGTHKTMFVGTGRYLGNKDLTDPATQTPVGTDAWQQSIYAFKINPSGKSGVDDDEFVSGVLRTGNSLVKQTITELSGGTTRSTTGAAVDWNTQNGWFVDLNPGNTSPGERVNIDPQLALGTLIVATNVPGGDTCNVGGDGWIYQFDYKTGLYVKNSPNSVLARKQSGALIVGVVVYQLQSGSIVGQVQRSETVMKQEDIYTQAASQKAKRTGWREIPPHK
jgi:type IV pilus assembly protein PilY1